MNAARLVKLTPLALLSLLTAALAAHCTRPAPQVVEMPPPPETFSLTATTVKRTDTAAPAESAAAPAESAAAPAANDAAASDASAAVDDASAAPSAEAPAVADTGARLAVRSALDAQHGALARCYDEILSTSHEAQGRVSVEFSVTSAGVISRADVRVEGEGGLQQARSCIEAAMRAVRFTGIPTQGAIVRRSYSFVNPALDFVITAPLRVQAPARNARPAAAPSAEAAAPARGVLTESEIATQLSLATPALQACYATTLRRASRAAGAGEVRMTLLPTGEAQSATWGSSVEPIALMGECIGTALRAVRFRNSGTGANIRASIEFAR